MANLMLHSWPSAIAATMILASGAVLLFAAWHDIVSRTVPNWMSIAIACCGLIAAFAGHRLAISAGLGFAVFCVAAACWRRGWMGGADVKLLGAIAIVLPPNMISLFAIAMSLAGAAHAVLYIAARKWVRSPVPATAAVSAPRDAISPPRSRAIIPARSRAIIPPRSRAVIPPRSRAIIPRALRAERWRISRGGPLPYACAIAFGFLFVVCNGGAP